MKGGREKIETDRHKKRTVRKKRKKNGKKRPERTDSRKEEKCHVLLITSPIYRLNGQVCVCVF